MKRVTCTRLKVKTLLARATRIRDEISSRQLYLLQWSVQDSLAHERCISLYWSNTVTEADVHFMGFHQIARAGWMPNYHRVQLVYASRGVKGLSYTVVCVNPTSDLFA